MKRLYLYYLTFRVFLAHRQLRKLGFRKMLDEADAHTLLQLARDVDRKRSLSRIKIGLFALVILSLWFVWRCHALKPAPVKLSPVIPARLQTQPDESKSIYSL